MQTKDQLTCPFEPNVPDKTDPPAVTTIDKIKAARVAAEEIIELSLKIGRDHPEYARHFFETIHNTLADVLTKGRLLQSAYSQADAQKWADSTVIEFGKHKGKKVADIPEQYLRWLDSQNDFPIKLRAYLQAIDDAGRNDDLDREYHQIVKGT